LKAWHFLGIPTARTTLSRAILRHGEFLYRLHSTTTTANISDTFTCAVLTHGTGHQTPSPYTVPMVQARAHCVIHSGVISVTPLEVTRPSTLSLRLCCSTPPAVLTTKPKTKTKTKTKTKPALESQPQRPQRPQSLSHSRISFTWRMIGWNVPTPMGRPQHNRT
jgi:hypothetical protein